MFRKDTFRMIKKTYKRFVSLVLIVLIGSGFMMGLMSTSTIMRKSMDAYNDEYNLQDIQIYSNYGFCLKDIETIKETEGVKMSLRLDLLMLTLKLMMAKKLLLELKN